MDRDLLARNIKNGTLMKKIILILIFLIGLVNIAESQTRLKFGGVFLKDTLSGDMKVTSGNLWTTEFIYADRYYVGVYNKIYLSDAPITGDFVIANNWDVATPEMRFYIDRTGGSWLWDMASGDKMTLSETGGLNVMDNLTVDSILTLRSSALITLDRDDSAIVVTSSCMRLSSDDATSTNRTFTISDGATTGQLLIIEWEGAVGSKEGEIIDGGSESGLNGTMTFDALDDTIMLKWTGTYWRELSRVEH